MIGKRRMKKAFITGVTGQDGAYLAEFLLEKGYMVHGLKRRTSSFNTDRIDHLYQDPHEEDVRFRLHHGDLTDSTNLIRIMQEIQPDEVYNLAAQSHVAVSLGPCGCLKLSGSSVWRRKVAFTKLQPQSFLERFRKFHRLKILRFTHVLLMR